MGREELTQRREGAKRKFLCGLATWREILLTGRNGGFQRKIARIGQDHGTGERLGKTRQGLRDAFPVALNIPLEGLCVIDQHGGVRPKGQMMVSLGVDTDLPVVGQYQVNVTGLVGDAIGADRRALCKTVQQNVERASDLRSRIILSDTRPKALPVALRRNPAIHVDVDLDNAVPTRPLRPTGFPDTDRHGGVVVSQVAGSRPQAEANSTAESAQTENNNPMFGRHGITC